MPRLKLIIAYDGTAYCGWQIQEKKNAPPTIQGELEKALRKICGQKIRAHGAGRTDSGVHAHGQCAHCDIPEDSGSRVQDWRKTLNALLPQDIRIVDWEYADPGFHARVSCLRKTYVYTFWPEWSFTPPELRHYVWSCGPLDMERMVELAQIFLGTHDFASFQNAGTKISGTERTIYSVELRKVPIWPERKSELLRLVICGNGFLKQMARNIAGALALAGKRRLAATELERILAAANRQALPAATAPAAGLALLRVEYPQDCPATQG